MLNELISEMEHLISLLEDVLQESKPILPGSDLHKSIEDAILEAKKII